MDAPVDTPAEAEQEIEQVEAEVAAIELKDVLDKKAEEYLCWLCRMLYQSAA